MVAWEDCPFDLEPDRQSRRTRRAAVHGDRPPPPGSSAARADAPSAVGWPEVGAASSPLTSSRRISSNHVDICPWTSRGPIRWHLRALFVAGTPMTRAVRACLSRRFGDTRLPARSSGSSRLRYIVIGTTADDDSSPLGVPMARGGERAIVVTSGYDKASRAVVLPFEAGDSVTPIRRQGRKQSDDHDRHIPRARAADRAARNAAGGHSAGAAEADRDVHVGRTDSVRAELRPWSVHERDRRAVGAAMAAPSATISTSSSTGSPSLRIATRVDVATAERDWTLIYEEAVSHDRVSAGGRRVPQGGAKDCEIDPARRIRCSPALRRRAVERAHRHGRADADRLGDRRSSADGLPWPSTGGHLVPRHVLVLPGVRGRIESEEEAAIVRAVRDAGAR